MPSESLASMDVPHEKKTEVWNFDGDIIGGISSMSHIAFLSSRSS